MAVEDWWIKWLLQNWMNMDWLLQNGMLQWNWLKWLLEEWLVVMKKLELLFFIFFSIFGCSATATATCNE